MQISQFISVAAQLALNSCRILKEIYQTNRMNTMYKDPLNAVTLADITIQSFIIQGLLLKWPTLKIIGEEDMKSTTQFNFNHQSLNSNLFERVQKKFLALDNLSIWIDPIDATNSYVNGRLDEVTILIGLSQNNQSKVGIIASPYRVESKLYIYEPKVVIGSVYHKSVFQLRQNYQIKMLNKKFSNLIQLTTSRFLSKKQESILVKISNNPQRVSGIGKKIMSMVYEKNNCMVILHHKTNKWDICAGEAIIKALGGTTSSIYNEKIQYIQNGLYQNYSGLVCSTNWSVHKKVISTLKAQLVIQ